MNKNILLFDGAMGTYYSQKYHLVGASSEYASVNDPELIFGIYEEYLKAGANAIKTNTFGVNRINFLGDENQVKRLIQSACNIATVAASSYDAKVFCDLGPVSDDCDDVFEEYRFLIDEFLRCGGSKFIFETLSNGRDIVKVCDYIREQNSEATVIVSFGVNADGYTRDGYEVQELFDELGESDSVDYLGLNCVSGGHHMKELVKGLSFTKPFSVSPNAGYPVVVNNRTFYENDPVYFAEQIKEMIGLGAIIVGGCCGTTPEHIKACRKVLENLDENIENPVIKKKNKIEKNDKVTSPFYEKLKSGEKVIAVELDSPQGVVLDNFMRGAWELKDAGTDIITIADCPIARARMDSSILACKIRRELNMDAMPHMTCRDRNLNATKALLFGQYAEGIRNVLLVTGDPIPTAERDEVKSVYQFNSRKLANYINSLVKRDFPGELHMFGALNINARNFDKQLELAKEKERCGMVGFLTQPALSEQAVYNLKKAKKSLKGYILGGIMPIVSERNAVFMNNEVNGINVDDSIIKRYSGKNREEGEELAVEISLSFIEKMKEYVDGYYMITPFNRTGLIKRIIKGIK